MKKRAIAAALVIGVLTSQAQLTGVNAQVLSESRHIGTVEVGTGEWWDGAHVENTTMFWEACDIQAPCYHYTIDVPEGGTRLRVAMDFSDRESRWALRLRPPGASVPVQFDPVVNQDVATEWIVFPAPTTMEISYPDGDQTGGSSPPAGRYVISVAPVHVVDDTFRLRAILDGAPTTDVDAPLIPLTPNARVVPPYNFSFDSVLDAQAQNGKPPTYGDVGIQQSCSEDEQHVDGATTCLRFAAGGFNDGAGPLKIRWDAGTTTSGTATQELLWSDGKTWTTNEDAGTFRFHEQHRHFHYEGAMKYTLFHVESLHKKKGAEDSPRVTLSQVGIGAKTSYCMVDYFIADWEATDQQAALEPNAVQPNCGSVRNRPFEMALAGQREQYEGRIGWSKGWGDIYPYWRQGQYVEFKEAPGDGVYVVRARFDEAGNLWETTKADNVAYALIEITNFGTAKWSIETLERGYGTDPWDENKTVIGLKELTWT